MNTVHVFTEFPVELNTKKGEWHPAMVDVIRVLDASEADVFERLCRAQGAAVVPGLLAVNGIALHEIGARGVLRTVMPVAQRRSPQWRNAVGWFVSLVPLEVPMAGVGEFAEVLAGAHKTFRTALSAADLPLASLFMHLGTRYLPINGFFDLKPQTHFSYIDYTILQSAFDPFFPRQASRAYWKSTYLDELTDDAVDTIARKALDRSAPMTGIGAFHLG